MIVVIFPSLRFRLDICLKRPAWTLDRNNPLVLYSISRTRAHHGTCFLLERDKRNNFIPWFRGNRAAEAEPVVGRRAIIEFLNFFKVTLFCHSYQARPALELPLLNTTPLSSASH